MASVCIERLYSSLENWIERSSNSVTPFSMKKKKMVSGLASLDVGFTRGLCEKCLSNICLVYVYAVSSSGVEPDLSGGLGAPATVLATPYST